MSGVNLGPFRRITNVSWPAGTVEATASAPVQTIFGMSYPASAGSCGGITLDLGVGFFIVWHQDLTFSDGERDKVTDIDQLLQLMTGQTSGKTFDARPVNLDTVVCDSVLGDEHSTGVTTAAVVTGAPDNKYKTEGGGFTLDTGATPLITIRVFRNFTTGDPAQAKIFDSGETVVIG